MRQKVDDLTCGMRVHAGEDVGHVVDRVDAVLLAASHERVEDGEVVARVLVAHKQEILTSESDAAKAGLGDVVVWRDRGESQESSELAKVTQQIANGASESGTWLEGVTMPAAPAEQLREERSRAGFAEREVLGGSEDARSLRLVLDGVDRTDDVERLLRLGMLTLLEELAACVRVIRRSG